MADRHPCDHRPRGPIQHVLQAVIVVTGITIWAAGRVHDALTEVRQLGVIFLETAITRGRRRG